MEQNNKYLVCTYCLTYNHAPYIEQTLNGFSMQEIDDPIVFAIIDDASTDGEQGVLMDWISHNLRMTEEKVAYHKDMPYGQLYFARHNKYSNLFFAFLLLSENHYQTGRKALRRQYISDWINTSKYVAQCEGDDYWIDPQKLQKQAEYMDSHRECILCGTNCLIVWDKGVMPPRYFNDIHESRNLFADDIIGKWALPTQSFLYKRELLKDWPDWATGIYSGDQITLLLALYRGTVYCFNDLTCVYRKNNTNITSMSNLLKKKPLSFQTEQHLKLYRAFDDYTNHIYQPLIGTVISSLEKKKKELDLRSSFYDLYRRSKALAFLRYPFVFFRLIKEKFTH